MPDFLLCCLLGHLLQHGNTLLRGQQVSLVEDNQHGGAYDLSDHEALGSLGLDALGAVDDKDHQVDDLGAPDDGLDEGGMARTVHQGDLQPGVPSRLDLEQELCYKMRHFDSWLPKNYWKTELFYSLSI